LLKKRGYLKVPILVMTSATALCQQSASGLPAILEELKKSLLPGFFSKNRRLIGQQPTEAPSGSALGAATRLF